MRFPLGCAEHKGNIQDGKFPGELENRAVIYLLVGGTTNHRYTGSDQKVHLALITTAWELQALGGLDHHKIYECVGKGFRLRGIVLTRSSGKGTQVFGTNSVLPRVYRLDLDVTFIWVSEKGGGEEPVFTVEGDRAINKADSKAYEMPQSKDPGAKCICSKDEKTENPLLVPIWVKLDINHSLKRCCGCLWL